MKSHFLAITAVQLPGHTLMEESSPMSFSVTSVGFGEGRDVGGPEGADAGCSELADAAGIDNKTWQGEHVLECSA